MAHPKRKSLNKDETKGERITKQLRQLFLHVRTVVHLFCFIGFVVNAVTTEGSWQLKKRRLYSLSSVVSIPSYH